MPRRLGGPCQAPLRDAEGNEDGICGHEGESSTWYGKRPHQFCGSHRAAWEKWKREAFDAVDAEEEPTYLTQMEAMLGARYCEPSKMKNPEKYNTVKKDVLQYLVQGTFTPDGYARGQTDTRWQSLRELTERCSKEDFEKLFKQHLKDLEKAFKRDAKRFKTAEQLEEE